jgi:hypothetical protein
MEYSVPHAQVAACFLLGEAVRSTTGFGNAAHQVDRLVLSGFTLKLTKAIMDGADYFALTHYSLWLDAKSDRTLPRADLQHCCRTANRKAVLIPNSSMPSIA